MRLLLDSHALLWSLADPDELRADARSAIQAPANDVFVSAASVWEISIKRARGRLETSADLVLEIEAARFQPLPISHPHGVAAGSLPEHHSDPIDRMLIAQAQLEGLTIVTRDPRFEPYGVPILKA
jgi:PIN domain nuclease of toxin-antitoxin system